jgi:hypothetical protein
VERGIGHHSSTRRAREANASPPLFRVIEVVACTVHRAAAHSDCTFPVLHNAQLSRGHERISMTLVFGDVGVFVLLPLCCRPPWAFIFISRAFIWRTAFVICEAEMVTSWVRQVSCQHFVGFLV